MANHALMDAAGAEFLDSDAGGRTGDDRAEAVQLLLVEEEHANKRHRPKPGDYDDSDDDIGVVEMPVAIPPSAGRGSSGKRKRGNNKLGNGAPPRPSHPAPAHPAVANILSQQDIEMLGSGLPPGRDTATERTTVTSKEAIGVPPPRIAKFQSVHTPISGTSGAANDDDDDEGDHAGNLPPAQRWSLEPPPPPALPVREHENRPQRGPPPPKQDNSRRNNSPSSADMYVAPKDPVEMLERFDEAQMYLVDMVCHLTGDNTHAVTARDSLRIFRDQMFAWGGLEGGGDWTRAAGFMLMYAETIRKVIHSTSNTAKTRNREMADRAAEEIARKVDRPEAATTPALTHLPPHPREGRDLRIPPPIPTDTERSDTVTRDTHTPIGMHYNNASGKAASVPATSERKSAGGSSESAASVPAYVARAEEPQKNREGECQVM